MKLNKSLLVLACVLPTMTMSHGAGNITIKLDGRHIMSTDTRQIAVKDTVCNADKGVFALRGNQVIEISICTNDSGYGRIEYRNVSNNGSWIGSSFLRQGESISP